MGVNQPSFNTSTQNFKYFRQYQQQMIYNNNGLLNPNLGIATGGSTLNGGGGTVYENPMLHGKPFYKDSNNNNEIKKNRSLNSNVFDDDSDFDNNKNNNNNSGLNGLYTSKDIIKDVEQKYDGIIITSDDDGNEPTPSSPNKSSINGNKINTKPKFKSIEHWVKYHNGSNIIKKLLIANNGISAVKCIKFIRAWCFNTFNNYNEIHFVVMATPEDINSNAEYIRMADEVVKVPGEGNNYNYANVPLIVNVALSTKCDAVWPGWGHASEYPSLPRALKENKIIWLGPDADAMYASGDKICSTLIAQTANVPTIPWSGDMIRLKNKKNGDYDINEIEIKAKQAGVKRYLKAYICILKNI